MKTIKFLEPEFAEKIEEITSRFSDVTPIDKRFQIKYKNQYFDIDKYQEKINDANWPSSKS